MGHLDEAAFARHLAGCPGCGGRTFDVVSYLDRHVAVMLGDADDDGKWVHDGEAFVDGVSRITCVGCGQVAYASDDCPRCHAVGTLPASLAATSHQEVPKRCPRCTGTQLGVIAFAPATVRTGAGKPPPPTATALFGDPGFHVVAIACDDCDWAITAPGCPLCQAPPPLRARPH
ncbi:MAG: hypothetical protein R3B06_27170 [Kofleriaceae bacterium]